MCILGSFNGKTKFEDTTHTVQYKLFVSFDPVHSPQSVSGEGHSPHPTNPHYSRDSSLGVSEGGLFTPLSY